jgi:hypothetical protein
MIGMNSITIQNNTIVILYLDDKEHGSERLTSYGKLHGNTASDLHWVAPRHSASSALFASPPPCVRSSVLGALQHCVPSDLLRLRHPLRLPRVH